MPSILLNSSKRYANMTLYSRCFLSFFYWLFKRFISATITNLAKMKSVSSTRTAFIIRCFNICCFVLLFATYIIVSGIGYGNFTIFISSLVTVFGVAFIAQWSILSNITASFLIFFVFPYRIGGLNSWWRMVMELKERF